MGVWWQTTALRLKRKYSGVVPRRFVWLLITIGALLITWKLVTNYRLLTNARPKALPWKSEPLKPFSKQTSAENIEPIADQITIKPTTNLAQCESPKVAYADLDTGQTMREMYRNAKMQSIWQSNYFALDNMKYDANEVKKQPKLKVFVVPFSHVDPGWLRTFDDYSTDTNKMLDNIVDYLPGHPNMTFMWTEICFLHKWWSSAKQQQKEIFKKLVQSGQVDITGGGWVMTDEASPHYWATIDNLIEGHQFVMQELGVKPEAAWSNDPFGYGSTVPYLFKKANIHSSVIHRIHRVLKVYYGREKLLDFNHRQYWDTTGENDMFVSVLRGHHYDILNTCGPSPSVCCQFDFKRITNFGCPGPKPVPITKENVKERSQMLYDQYRQMAQLYRKSSILIPLGDDFRYDFKLEFEQQNDNYQQLFDYMNSQSEWNIEAKFSTYSKYFQEVRRSNNVSMDFPVLTGDFYPYADTGEHIWTGYFSSRPFYKKMERILQSRIRAADLLANLASPKLPKDSISTILQAIVSLIRDARRDLALFQHHDAITGTSRPHVVKDYGKKLWIALRKTDISIAACAQILLTKKLPSVAQNLNLSAGETWKVSGLTHEMNEMTPNETLLPSRIPVMVQKLKPTKVILYNQLTESREELIRILVKTPEIEVLDQDDKPVLAQLNPHILHDGKVDPITFELLFVAHLAPLSLAQYSLKHAGSVPSTTVFASIATKSPSQPSAFPTGFHTSTLERDTFSLKSPTSETVHSAETGMLLALNGKKMVMNFWMYTETSSGPYIFYPSKPAQRYSNASTITYVIKGVVASEVFSLFPNIFHHFTLINSSFNEHRAIAISNHINMAGLVASEIVMRLETDITDEERYFYTDQNGFQNIRRQYFPERKVQENYFPIATTIFLQNLTSRVSLFSAQPHGASSPAIGLLEVMLHRVSAVDDTKGLGTEAIMRETLPTRSDFRLLLEPRIAAVDSAQTNQSTAPYAHNSLLGHQTFQFLLYNVLLLHQIEETGDSAKFYSPVKSSFPCDLELLHLRFINRTDERLLVLQKMAFDCTLPPSNSLENCSPPGSTDSLVELLSSLKGTKLQKTSLSGLFDVAESVDLNKISTELKPMDIQSYKLLP